MKRWSTNSAIWLILTIPKIETTYIFGNNTFVKVMDQSALSRKVDPQEAAMKKAADEMARFDPQENNIWFFFSSQESETEAKSGSFQF